MNDLSVAVLLTTWVTAKNTIKQHINECNRCIQDREELLEQQEDAATRLDWQQLRSFAAGLAMALNHMESAANAVYSGKAGKCPVCGQESVDLQQHINAVH